MYRNDKSLPLSHRKIENRFCKLVATRLDDPANGVRMTVRGRDELCWFLRQRFENKQRALWLDQSTQARMLVHWRNWAEGLRNFILSTPERLLTNRTLAEYVTHNADLQAPWNER